MRSMLLNQTAVYGLRALAVLAQLAPGESVNAAGLSERTGVPQQYLSKVMRKLVIAKLVRARRGHGGGFGLARAPRDVRLADVFAALELDTGGGCAFGEAACDPKHPCALHPIWSQLQSSFDAWSSGCTLADGAPAAERSGKARRG